MKQSLHQHSFRQEPWPWPLPLDAYDTEPRLRESEYAELEKRFRHPHGHIPSSTTDKLARIVRPMSDVLVYLGAPPHTYKDTLHIMLLERYRRGTTFWAWTLADWQAMMCQNPLLFAQRFGRSGRRTLARRHLPVLAYLLKVQPDIKPLIELGEQVPLAHNIFGKEAVDRALEPPFAVLRGWGYSLKASCNPAACLAYLLLRNESPILSHLSFDLLVEVSQTCQLPCVQQSLYRISRALCALGIIEHPLPDARVVPPQWRGSTSAIAPQWLAWVERWRKHSTRCASYARPAPFSV